MKVKNFSIIYENPMPQLNSRQAMFPYLTEYDGKVLCSFVIGEAFESVDETSYVCESIDEGKTWSNPKKIFTKPYESVPTSDCCKVTAMKNGDLVGMGYYFFREDENKPLGNAETGGLLEDRVFLTQSIDGGKTWSNPRAIKESWGGHTEASAPIIELNNGDYVTAITGFPTWEGKMTSRNCGRLLVSHDKGETWSDQTVCMEFDGDTVTCYEQRICQLDNGVIVDIGWNENTKTGERLNNHYTLSFDNGKTFTKPIDTGIHGQASSVCSLENGRLLSLHAVRRDTDKVGVYAYVVNLSDGKWKIEDKELIWGPNVPIFKDNKMADIFSFLKFGQPSAVKLKNGKILVTFWFAENGQYKVACIELEM